MFLFSADMVVDKEKLAALQAKQVQRVGGKRVAKKPSAAKPVAVDDKRVKNAIAKLGAREVPQIDEINMFKKDGKVLHFTNPKLHASIQNNAFVVTGIPQDKKLEDMLPGVVSQMGLEGLEQLKNIYTAAASSEGINLDEMIPDLVSQ